MLWTQNPIIRFNPQLRFSSIHKHKIHLSKISTLISHMKSNL